MELSKPTKETFVSALQTLSAAKVPFMVGGAFAVYDYTGYLRNTKDIDLFLNKRDVDYALERLGEAGFRTKVDCPHWLAKAFKNGNLIDLIFASSNWVMEVDDSWFARSVPGEVLGIPVRLLAPEEMIWTKSYVAARERFDGSDIAHLISASKKNLDWNHLLERFGEHWQLLLANVLVFSFVYPSERGYIPGWLLDDLIGRTRQVNNEPAPKERVCRGTLLDRYSYVVDVEKGYLDAREKFAERLGYSPEQVVEDRERAGAELQAAFYK